MGGVGPGVKAQGDVRDNFRRQKPTPLQGVLPMAFSLPGTRLTDSSLSFKSHLEPVLAGRLKPLYLCRNREDAEDLRRNPAVQACAFDSF